jgi:hypothetical protein
LAADPRFVLVTGRIDRLGAPSRRIPCSEPDPPSPAQDPDPWLVARRSSRSWASLPCLLGVPFITTTPRLFSALVLGTGLRTAPTSRPRPEAPRTSRRVFDPCAAPTATPGVGTPSRRR